MAVVTVTISGHVLAPDGSAPTSGRITAKLSSSGSTLDGAESVRVAAEVTEDLGTGGSLSFGLVPNDAITPSGTYYLVTFIVGLANGRRAQWAERWQLTSSDLTLDIGAVPRLDAVPGLSVAPYYVPGDASAMVVTSTGSSVARTLAARSTDILNVKDFGADSAASATTNTNSIQAAIDLAASRGGATVLVPASATAYSLDATRIDPYYTSNKCCLEMKSNVRLIIETGATLKLGDGQQTDAGGPVNIITAGNVQHTYIGGGGRITGNTAGQTGWTLGYAQVGYGIIISYRRPVDGAASDVTIENLTLDDHWSNPINLGQDSSTLPRLARITIRNIYTANCGEGPQIIGADDVIVAGMVVEDLGGVHVGDGFELSDADRFTVSDLIVRGVGAGSAIDLFGSQNGVVTNFVIDGWVGGIDINDNSHVPPRPCANLVVGPGVMTGTDNYGIIINGLTASNIVLTDIVVDGQGVTDYGMQLASANAPVVGPVMVTGCLFTGCQYDGMMVKALSKLTIEGCESSGNGANGLTCYVPSVSITSADIADLVVLNTSLTNNAVYGLAISGSGFSAVYSGVIRNVRLDGSGTGLSQIDRAATVGLVMENITPSTFSSSTTLGATYNDYDGYGAGVAATTNVASTWRITSGSTTALTGIVGGRQDRRLNLISLAGSFVLKNQDAASVAGNRIITGTGTDYTIPADGSVTLLYDATSLRWRVMA